MPQPCALKKTLLGLAISCAAFITQASATYYPHCEPIATGIQRLLSKANPSVHIGVVVQSLDTGRTYYSHNANHYFEPASVQKLFTVSSALINLKPDYRFPTRLLATGNISQGTLHGNLIFQFNGDPSLTQTDLKNLMGQLRNLGIHHIAGNVVIDNNAYNHIPYPAGWVWNDLIFDFAAPLDSIIINRNRFGVSITPTRVGAKPIITPHLPPGAATFYNEAITTNHICPLSIVSNEKNEYVVRGCIPKRAGTEGRALAVRNMEMYSKSLIRELLMKQGISVSGFEMIGNGAVNAQVIGQHFSAPLSQVIVHLLKKSDNLYADSLLKKMGEHYSHAPGSWENGLQAMYPVLSNDAGINLNQIHLIDGAGLSRYNLMTPADLSRLLSYIAHNPMLRNTLIPALPIAGVDGTLAFRMADLAHGKRFYAKTGSMTGVSCLAGFIKTEHHGLLSYVIMINNIPKNRYPYIVLENDIAEYLAKSPNCG